MPLPQPNLDDLTYADLVEEARSLIPGLAPEWTDHNPTDPGIVLIELLAWLTEITLYRVNRVPEANYRTFLSLLSSDQDNKRRSSLELSQAIRETVQDLRARYRAITVDDFTQLLLQDWPTSAEASNLAAADRSIARVLYLPNTDLDRPEATKRDGHVTLVVVPQTAAPHPEPAENLRTALQAFLQPRCLLTTFAHVVAPVYVRVQVTARLVLKPDAEARAFPQRATAALEQFFHPLRGGAEGEGWTFGRPVYDSEVYRVLDQVDGVDYVENLVVEGQISASHQLVSWDQQGSDIRI